MKLVSLILLLISVPAGTASQPLWIVDRGDHYCSLARGSTSSAGAVFALRTIPGANISELWFFDQEQDVGANITPGPVEIAFSPQGVVIPQNIWAGLTAKIVIGLSDDFPDQLARADSIEFKRKGETLLKLPVPRAAEAIEAWRTCQASVLRDWGIDPTAHFSLREPAKSKYEMSVYFRNDDYPRRAAMAGVAGTVISVLEIGVDGRAGNCRVVASGGHEALDERTCEVLLKRGRFEPAIDRNGKPVSATMVTRVRWALPDR